MKTRISSLFAVGAAAQSSKSLGEWVTFFADHPTDANQEILFRLFLKEKVGVLLMGGARLPIGTHVNKEPLMVQGALAPDGTMAMLVFCDIPRLQAAHPDKQYGEMDSQEILRLAHDRKSGVMVCNGLDGKDSWGYIPPADVERLLRKVSSVGASARLRGAQR